MGRPERPVDPGAGPVPEFAVELRKLREEAGRPSYRELARRAHFSVTVLAEAAGGRCLPTLAVVRGYVAGCGGDVAEWEKRWQLAAARQQAGHQQAGHQQAQHQQQAQQEAQDQAPQDSLPAQEKLASVHGNQDQNRRKTATSGRLRPRLRLRLHPRLHRRLVVALAVLAVAVTVAGGVAAWQHRTTLAAQNSALSGQLAAQSARFATVNSDAATLAALAAWQAAPTVTARSALLSLTACCTSTQASLSGESATVNAVALSPGGKLLAAGGDDRAVHLWDTATGRQLAVFGGFAGPVRAVAFGSDGSNGPVGHGRLLAAGTDGHTIQVWDAARHTRAGELDGTAAIENLAFSPTTALLAAVTADGQILLWDPANPKYNQKYNPKYNPDHEQKPEQVLTQHQPGRTPARLLTVAFSPDGRTLAAAGAGHVVALWNVTDLTHPAVIRWLSGATGSITHLAYDPGGDTVAAEETGGDVLVWNPRQHDPVLLPHAVGNSHGLAFSRDGTVLITAGSYEDLLLWNTGTARLAGSTPRRIPGNANALAYDPASGSLAMGGQAGAVQFWRAPVPPFTGSTGPVTGLASVPGSTMIATVSGDGMLRLWNGSGSPVSTTRLTARPAAIAVSPGGKLLAAIGHNGALTLRGIPGLTPTLSVRTVAPAADAVFSPNGEMVATAAGYTVAVRNTGSTAPRQSFHSRHGYFKAVAFSPDGRTVAAATTRGSVMLWDVQTGRRIAEADPATGQIHAIAFSPDGQTLATAGDDGDITFWSPADLHRRVTLPGPVGSVQALAFSPDGKILASAGRGGTIMLWDTASLSLTATLTSNDGPVNALAFAPGGRSLISGDNRNRIVVWDLNPADLTRQACRTLAGDPGLSQAETLVPNASYPRLCPSR